jgi:hypothetical protein
MRRALEPGAVAHGCKPAKMERRFEASLGEKCETPSELIKMLYAVVGSYHTSYRRSTDRRMWSRHKCETLFEKQ